MDFFAKSIKKLIKSCDCDGECNVKRFKQNFKNWTSGDNYIDKYIQDSQLSDHSDYTCQAIEWIPYNRLYDIKYISEDKFCKVYRAKWTDGYIDTWDNEHQDWKRKGQNMFVILKSLNSPADVESEFINEFCKTHEFYGITQDLVAKNYMVVLDDECEKCKYVCCKMHFLKNFQNWTSGNEDVDKFIQDIQLSMHGNHYGIFGKAIEWIPYNKFYDIEYITKDVYRAKWIDGYIIEWDYKHQNWKREGQNIFIILKSLNNPADVALEFRDGVKINHRFYGITQDPETKNYIKVLSDICEKCKYVCSTIHFQRNFKNWTSGNEDVDKFIKDSQLSTHVSNYEVFERAIEWIPYNRFYNIEYITKNVYRAKWIDGYMNKWDYAHQNWKREGQNIFVILKSLNNPADIALEFRDGVHEFYGITHDSKTKNYMKVLNDICEKCKYACNIIHFQHNFENWTSGNEYIDIFIQDAQLSAHGNYEVFRKAIEWIPHDKFYDIEYITKDGFDKVYEAKWIDGYINEWDCVHQNWKRKDQNIFVILKSLNNPAEVALEFSRDVVKINHEFYGITQDSKTKNYMKVLNAICEKCKYMCSVIYFQHNFKNWTSGNEKIDKFIQDAQLLTHDNYKAIEWIPYNKFYNIEYITKDVYRAKWIDGNIIEWDYKHQNWKREGQNIFVILKSLNNPADVILEFSIDEVEIDHEFYGITQDPKTKNYMKVLNDICEKCKYACNIIHFQQNFKNWTSGNEDIDKFIQNAQLSAHHSDYDVLKKAIEWIPYNKFYDIEYIAKDEFDKVYRAKWIDGYINKWDHEHQNWKRKGQNMFVILKSLNNSADVTMDFINRVKINHEFYGITQDLGTKNYMIVLDNTCIKCKYACSMIHFQQNFKNWTSGNEDVDKFIQDAQLSAHDNYDVFRKAIEWIPFNRFYDIEYITEDGSNKVVYRAKWIDGYINEWDYEYQNWKRKGQNMFVILKSLNNPADATLEFMDEIITVPHEVYGITQNLKTKNYFVVWNEICGKCNSICTASRFKLNFESWTSSNNEVDKFIQDAQLSTHDNYEVFKKTLEWIPYNRFYDIKYIAKGGFGKVYKARWIDGYIDEWDNKHQNWKRKDQSMFVALKSLNNSKSVTLEFMNEIILHYKLNLQKRIIKHYGVTQEPETKNYVMVLDYAENGSLRNYLNTNYDKLSWSDKINYLHSIAHGLKDIHEEGLIHRDLHIGNILRLKKMTCITDMGLCKPADYNTSENHKNKIFGVLPYIAPEILRGQNYTKASDIYSFGIIMYEVISGSPPYHDISHNNNLAIRICQGLRPRFNIKVPRLIVNLIKRCLDANQLNRPKAEEIKKFLSQWLRELNELQNLSEFGNYTEIQKQIDEAEIINNRTLENAISTNLGISSKTHSEAIYTSRLLNFNNLPEPKNTDDYYKENDNIISMKSSESLLIDISQLKINDNNLPEPKYSDDYCKENVNIISMESPDSLNS